jgi:hypothetical protein
VRLWGAGLQVKGAFTVLGQLGHSTLLTITTVFAFVVSFAVLIEGVGLYPPRGGPILDDQSYYLANGSLAQYPLDNYQYPRMSTVDILDMDSIWQAHPSVNTERLCKKIPSCESLS